MEVNQKEYICHGSLSSTKQPPSEFSEILKHQNFIQKTFNGDLLSIMSRLNKSPILFAKKTYAHLLTRCPMSLAVTVELLNRAEHLSLKDCLKMEFQLSQYIVYRDDFNEGVNSVLISKTHNPKWNPQTINDINFIEVKSFFNPHVEPLNIE